VEDTLIPRAARGKLPNADYDDLVFSVNIVVSSTEYAGLFVFVGYSGVVIGFTLQELPIISLIATAKSYQLIWPSLLK
jgi:hypothetical protein